MNQTVFISFKPGDGLSCIRCVLSHLVLFVQNRVLTSGNVSLFGILACCTLSTRSEYGLPPPPVSISTDTTLCMCMIACTIWSVDIYICTCICTKELSHAACTESEVCCSVSLYCSCLPHSLEPCTVFPDWDSRQPLCVLSYYWNCLM